MSVQEIELKELQRLDEAPEDIYLRRGQKIYSKGARFPLNFVETLQELGVQVVYSVPDESIEQFQFDAINQKVDLESPVLRREGKLSQSLFNKRGDLLLEAGGTWTKDLARRLRKLGELTIYLRRPDDKISQDKIGAEKLLEIIESLEPAPDPEELKRKKKAERKAKKSATLDFLPGKFDILDKRMFSTAGLDSYVGKSDTLAVPDDQHALRDQLLNRDVNVLRSEEEKKEIVTKHRQWVRDLRYLMEAIALSQSIDTRNLANMCKGTMQALIEDQDLLLNATFLEKGRLEDFVFSHSVNSTIVAINIAAAMGYSALQIYELSFGAFLHDVGMLKVPPEILMKPGKLTESERSEIYKHPIHSLDLLQKLPGLPVASPLIAYQTHERGDKGGYPRRKPLNTIHRYARIVAVADVYCAMCAPRPYRAAHSPYAVMEYMTREAVQGRLDRDVLRAFMGINSLYPVGSWVVLNDQRIGKVVSATAGKFDRPILRVFFEGTKRLEEPITMDLADEEFEQIRVIKTFDGTRLKIATMEGF